MCQEEGGEKKKGRGAHEAGSYLRLIDSSITQLKDQGPSRTCNESKEEEGRVRLTGLIVEVCAAERPLEFRVYGFRV